MVAVARARRAPRPLLAAVLLIGACAGQDSSPGPRPTTYAALVANTSRLLAEPGVRAGGAVLAEQRRVLAAAAPFWRAARQPRCSLAPGPAAGSYNLRGDHTMYTRWLAWAAAAELPGAVYVPLPWHFILEECARGKQLPELAQAAMQLVGGLRLAEFPHVLTLMQASLWQLEELTALSVPGVGGKPAKPGARAGSRRGGAVRAHPAYTRLAQGVALVFDARGTLPRAVQPRARPIPLLYDAARPLVPPERKRADVMFAGTCTSPARCALSRALYDARGAPTAAFRASVRRAPRARALSWALVQPCLPFILPNSRAARASEHRSHGGGGGGGGGAGVATASAKRAARGGGSAGGAKRPSHRRRRLATPAAARASRLSADAFRARQGQCTWFIAPRGTYPASLNMYEALQVGTLPVHIWAYEPKQRCPPCDCVDWPRERRWTVPPPEPWHAPWLPYVRELGVDYSRIGLVVHASEVGGLVERLQRAHANASDVRARLARAAELRPLFTPAGAAEFVRHEVAELVWRRLRAGGGLPSAANATSQI